MLAVHFYYLAPCLAGNCVLFCNESKSAPMTPVRFLTACLFVLAVLPLQAQVCPGGGVNFNVAVPFDLTWIYGCNTGTSCNGGVAFDNRISCQPTTSLDACAPPPSCGTAGWNASNVWFTFYATGTTALISCFQNTSLVLGIQAFSGGPSCGSLTQIGCAVSGGPSSGVQLALSGLHYGQLYYFRIFGSANPVSQRTGLYCFCGSKGLNDFTILPVSISKFKATPGATGINLSWNLPDTMQRILVPERSTDGTHYSPVGGTPVLTGFVYSLTDQNAPAGLVFYRLKEIFPDGRSDFGQVVTVKSNTSRSFSVLGNVVNNNSVRIDAVETNELDILDLMGRRVGSLYLKPGTSDYPLQRLKPGIYLLQEKRTKTECPPVKMLITRS